MDTNHKQTNRLIHSSSPYLLEHANNPVDWFPWSNEAFEKARNENKLVLVSIGYSSCHWCHVMASESFNDPEVARLMNEHYVCIKVDREERPDIDNVYMDAVQLLTGSGGWPLNCFTLPNGKPVWGGTYFPKEQWTQILTNLADKYQHEPEKIQEQANSIADGVNKLQYLPQSLPAEESFSDDDIKAFIQRMLPYLDFEYGGTKGAPKFPMPVLQESLLKYNFYYRNSEIGDYLYSTLDNMIQGGLYDQLAGGFARYSTDSSWLIPHFEKMLYDNAQLVSLYSHAYLVSKKDQYKQVVIETLDFLKKELMGEQYIFFSSLDADSEGEEGKYYTWSKKEFERLIIEQSSLVSEYFDLTEEGNIEGRNVLHVGQSKDELAKKYGLSIDTVEKIIKNAKNEMLKNRKRREEPDLDNKVITGWNALAIKAFLDGYKATAKKEYLRIAVECAEFLVSYQLRNDYRLNRIYVDGKSSVNGFLDDYAYLIDALINLYQVTFDEKWIDWSYKLTEYVIKHFQNKNSTLFNYKSDIDEQLIAPKIEIVDTVMPASNSMMAKNLFILGQYFYTDSYIKKARKMLLHIKPTLEKNPVYFTEWFDLMMWFVYTPYEVAIVGKKSEEFKERFLYIYHPGLILGGGMHEGNLPMLKNRFKLGQTKIYICQGKVCQEPLNNVDEAIKKIS
jgi:uncharacterized protein YyaL (SSP411 family)